MGMDVYETVVQGLAIIIDFENDMLEGFSVLKKTIVLRQRCNDQKVNLLDGICKELGDFLQLCNIRGSNLHTAFEQAAQRRVSYLRCVADQIFKGASFKACC